MLERKCELEPDHAVPARVCILLLAITLISIPKAQAYVPAAPALPRFIDEYNVPTPNSAPLALTVDQNGIVWFSESNASKLGRFDPATHAFTEYKVPGVGDMWGITIDAGGSVWLTQYSLKGSVSPGGAIAPGGSGRLIRFNPNNGNFSVVNIPTPGAFPFRIIADNKGRIWFTELLGNRIGSYDPASGELSEYSVPTQFAGPADLTFDNHGLLWFTEAYNESVASFDLTTKAFVEYHFSIIDPTQYVSSPVGIAVGPNGIVWVADHGGNWVVEFNSTSNHIIRYPTHFPPPQVYPISLVNDLLLDSHGRLWFAEHGGNSIGYLEPGAREMVEFAIPTGPLSTALWLALAPNGDVWFTEWSANKIGVVHADVPVPFSLTASQDYLNLEPGSQSSLSVTLSGLQGRVASGSYVFSWPSYSPEDVNVVFSPANASLMTQTTISSQASISVSPSVLPGHYVLGLGFDAGSVRVWTMIPTNVTARTALAGFVSENMWFIIGATVVALVAVVMLRRRFRSGIGKG